MIRKYRELQYGEPIYVACDTSMGLGDYCAAQFFSSKKLDIPLVYHSKQLATVMTNELHPILEKIFDITGIKPLVAYERNNGGVFELERLASLNRLGKYEIFVMPNTDKIGWDTNSATRPEMLAQLKDAIDKHLIEIYDKETVEELMSFVKVQHSGSIKAEAERGAHDDLVMPLAIVYKMYQAYPSRALSTIQMVNQPVFNNDRWRRRR